MEIQTVNFVHFESAAFVGQSGCLRCPYFRGPTLLQGDFFRVQGL
jgi:hypothetical protein